MDNDEVRWALTGIKAEKEHLQARLALVEKREQELTHQGMTGAATKPATARPSGKTPAAKSGKGKRKVSAETRKLLSEGAKRRWEKRKEADNVPGAAGPAATYVPPVPTAETAPAGA